MLRYILRRILQAIPTVIGVILITFILFNVAGGDPVKKKLGQHGQPRDMQALRKQLAMDRPLLFGWRTKTYAYGDSEFKRFDGRWRDVKNVEYDRENGLIRLAAGGTFDFPVAFQLTEDSNYEWGIEYRCTGEKPPAIGKTTLEISNDWKKERVRFQTLEKLAVGDAPLEIRSLKLRRLQRNPFDSQLAHYFVQLWKFDFGTSIETNQRVSRMLKDGVIPSLTLTIPIFVIGLVVAISLSLLCAFFRDTWIDRFFVVLSVILMSVNYIVWIVAGQYILAYRMGGFPVWGYESLRYLILPVIIGVVSGLGGNVRFYRTIMLDEMYRDYIRTAFAKGVGRTGVLFKHVLKNAMIPIITNVVIAIPFLYTGSLLLESFFGIPGLGYLSVNAFYSSDIVVVRAIVLIGALMFVFANILSDICYALADPRVRLK
ncbi:MAG: ABC transporter permease subunit [Kiritimatiellales bacterium]|nr:ABC transporter permease subunit [Kiritimatiellales bacterium]